MKLQKSFLHRTVAVSVFLLFLSQSVWADAVVSYHPRIFLTPDYINILKDRANANTPQWQRLKNQVNKINSGTKDTIIPLALAYIVTEDPTYGNKAVDGLIELVNEMSSYGVTSKDVALYRAAIGFDWLYNLLTAEQKTAVINAINDTCDVELFSRYLVPWHNYGVAVMRGVGIAGYATYHDNPNAQNLINHARKERFNKLLDGMNQLFGSGGGWPEGRTYGFSSVPDILQYVEAVYTATNENLYSASSWFKDRLRWLYSFEYPGTFYDRNREYHYDGTWDGPKGKPYFGYYNLDDGHKGMSSITDAGRMEKLILIKRFPDEPAAKQVQWLITQPPKDKMVWQEPHLWEDFLWFNPNQLTEAPDLLAHYASGIGTVTMRSDWTDDATWIFFKCGDYFTGHQHLDQNSFSIFKKGDLAIKSGIYDGSGSYHDHIINFYTRTIASNSILIYNPDEEFGPWRAGHNYPRKPMQVFNDGGQRAYKGGVEGAVWTEESKSVTDWLKYKDRHEMGDILHYEHNTDYTYVYGDATRGYNNPDYVTPKEQGRGYNKPKVTLFSREMAYLRPKYVVIFDRVNATDASYKKKWLLHSLNQPVISGYTSTVKGDAIHGGTVYVGADMVVVGAGDGKLFTKVLLPISHQIRQVGGKDNQDYWVFGMNMAPAPNMSRWGKGYGEWRIEVEPTVTQQNDLFLHILYPCENSVSEMPQAVRIDATSGGMVGVHIKDGVKNWVAMFNKVKGVVSVPVTYTIEPTADCQHLLFDMKNSTNYDLSTAISSSSYTITVTENAGGSYTSSAQGVLSFTFGITPPYTSGHSPVMENKTKIQ